MTKVAILWHQHQPYYGDPETREQVLPWVRLHALKDYYGMVALLSEFPAVRATFNLVPSLLVQLEDLGGDRGRDRYLDLSMKPAADLSPDERAFIVANFFHAQRARMIEPRPRYAELLAKREAAAPSATAGDRWHAAASVFSEADLRDLQVWQKLAWIDPYYLDSDARVRRLIEKRRGYSEADKRVLHEVELEIIGRVIPAHREAADRGQVELSTSPFYHPILPLLCDTDIYLRLHPEAQLAFRFSRPEDAEEQLVRGVAAHARIFGRPPAGFWPPEGSVSEAIVPIARRQALAWMATDEIILARSRGLTFSRDPHGHVEQPEELYRPYRVRVREGEITCLFRDHVLSDLIGFSYANWPSEAAAADLVTRLVEAGRRFTARSGGEEATVLVALDGENAWEHFEGGGRPFLRALYRMLSDHRELKTVTMSEAAGGAARNLVRLAPGSWAGGDFYIWIGHADDRKGWTQLTEARRVWDEATDAPPDARAQAFEELLAAEGSDWFWWYGDDHSSDQDFEFDALFRSHLRHVYKTLGRPVPEDLFTTNISVGVAATEIVPPTGPLQPVLDGRVTDEQEWAGAGYPVLREIFGAMHRSSEAGDRVVGIRFGTGGGQLYMRVDTATPARALLSEGVQLNVSFTRPSGVRVAIREEAGRPTASVWDRGGDGVWRPRAKQTAEAGVDQIVELRIPIAELAPGSAWASFFVTVFKRGTEVERYPFHGPVDVALTA